MDPFFSELGRMALARWRACNFAPSEFPRIARELLEERPPSACVEVSAWIRDFLLRDEQPVQSQSAFGQPELIVFDDPRLYIQVLFWMEGTTDIHQHMFSGAFHVLQGSSIHSEFEFADRRAVSANLQLGDLQWRSSELLEAGATREIRSGQGFVHSLFHLDTPSVTVVLRTQSDPGSAPQWTLARPATIPRARAAKTEQKAISYQSLQLLVCNVRHNRDVRAAGLVRVRFSQKLFPSFASAN